VYLLYYQLMNDPRKPHEMRNFLIGVAIVILSVPVFMYININTPKFTSYSPDKEYSLAVYREISLSTLLKSGSFNMAKIILKDKNGKKIAVLDSKNDCKIEYKDVYNSWDLANNKAYYSDSKMFMLPTGEIICK